MPKWTACKRRNFIKKLIRLGFSAPEPGGRHFYMRYGNNVLTTPNNSEYTVLQLKMLMKELEALWGERFLWKNGKNSKRFKILENVPG